MKFYQKTWFVILMLILFFPVGLFLMWKYKKEWKKSIKIGVTCLIAILWLFTVFSSGSPSQDGNEIGKATGNLAAIEAQAETTTEPTTAAPETTTEATTAEQTTEEKTEAKTEKAKPQQNASANSGKSSSGSNTASKPKTQTQQKSDPDAKVKVYITPTGKRYHYDGHCNGGTYIESNLKEAKQRNLTPCKKCAKKDLQ